MTQETHIGWYIRNGIEFLDCGPKMVRPDGTIVKMQGSGVADSELDIGV